LALQYAGGTLDVRTVVVGATPLTDWMTTLAASATAAGWTVTNLSQFNLLSGNTNAANGQTVTINARVYTFNTVLGGADSILIGGTALATLQNLKAAINGAAGSGTTYGIGTAVNADVTAAFADMMSYNGSQIATLAIYTKATLGLATSEASNYGWAVANLTSTLYRFVSVETPGFQQVYAFIGADPATPGTVLDMMVMNRDQSVGVGQSTTRVMTNGQSYRFITHRYGFHSHLVGTYNTRGTGVYLQAPYLPGNLAPCKIIGATNATPIVIQTSAAHGYATGDSVKQQYVEGNTAANGVFTVTVVDTTHYSLDASVGNGAFTGTKGLAQNTTPPRRQQMEFIFGNCMNFANDSWEVGSLFYFGISSGQGAYFGIADGAGFNNSTAYEGYFPRVMSKDSSGNNVDYVWASGAYVAVEPFLIYKAAYGGNAAGPQLYNAAFVQAAVVPGGATTTYDGHSWYGVYNNDGRGQLLLALT